MLFTAENYEKEMEKYYDTVRRYATEEGRADGLKIGRAEGLEEGRAEGLEEGHAQGLAEGLAEGRTEALEEAKQKAIDLLIELDHSKEDATRMVEEKF